MKFKLIKLSILLLSSQIFAQVAIGKNSVTNNSVSLEFGNITSDADKQKGLLLPWVTSAQTVTGAIPGTLIFDTSDKKVKYLKGGATSEWIDLTITETGAVDTSLQDNIVPKATEGVIIGTPEDSTINPHSGILTLEDKDKAMVLPIVDNYLSIENPSPGIIAYDSEHDMLCVFNGTEWTFWRATD